MLQSFGTELAETELPNDVQSTSTVLFAHTEKKDKVKVRVASVQDGKGKRPMGIRQDRPEPFQRGILVPVSRRALQGELKRAS